MTTIMPRGEHPYPLPCPATRVNGAGTTEHCTRERGHDGEHHDGPCEGWTDAPSALDAMCPAVHPAEVPGECCRFEGHPAPHRTAAGTTWGDDGKGTHTVSTPGGDIAGSLPELANLINFRVGAWHDFGYAAPPSPECKAIRPLGERSADAIRNGHQAVRDIDEMIRQLYKLRGRLVSELRTDEDLRAVRVDAWLAETEARRADGAR